MLAGNIGAHEYSFQRSVRVKDLRIRSRNRWQHPARIY